MPGRPRSYSLPFVQRYANNNNNRASSRLINLTSKICDEVENEPNEGEIDLLEEFKKLVRCELEIPNEFYDDDYYYLKWLRARGYDMEKAYDMLKKHLEWRESCTYLTGIMDYYAPEDILEHLLWKRLGTDFQSRPIYCFLFGRADIKYLMEHSHIEHSKRYCHKVFEILQNECNEQRKESGYGKAIGIIDMTGFTFTKAMSLELIQFAIYFARVFEANYPEALYRAYIINAGWFFTSVYNAVKPFLSHETLDKIQIFGSDQSKYHPVLQSTIPDELIPEEYGGGGESVEEFQLHP